MSCAEKDPEGQELVARIHRRQAIRRGVERVVGEAVGGGSVCWENMNGTGVFQDQKARKIVDDAVAELWLLFEMQTEMEKADV